MRHTHIEGLIYKTTLLNGRWDLGEGGIRVFGLFWVLPAIGFVTAALAFLAALDWSSAFMEAVMDIAIPALVSFGPRMPRDLEASASG